VLAHSLRDNGTTKKLAILVTEDTVSAEVISQLRVGTFPAYLQMGRWSLTGAHRRSTTRSSPSNASIASTPTSNS